MPKVTVAIPLYNKGRYVRRAVDSVLRQTFQDFELIVVDDGSSDDGPDLVKAYTDPRLTLVSQQNAGPGAARNRALAMAQAPLITFLDADDAQQPTFIEVTTGFLDEHPECAMVTTGFNIYPGPTSSQAMFGHNGLTDGVHEVTPSSNTRFVYALHNHATPCSTLARAETLRRFGGFFDDYKCLYGEDQSLMIQVGFNCKLGVIMQPHVDVHTEASELSSTARGPRPVPPYLQDATPLYKTCPEEKRHVLDRVLAFRAAALARYYVQDAEPLDPPLARSLLARFPYPGDNLLFRLGTEVWVRAPWLCGILRPIKRALCR